MSDGKVTGIFLFSLIAWLVIGVGLPQIIFWIFQLQIPSTNFYLVAWQRGWLILSGLFWIVSSIILVINGD